jgi:signal transduction histidine kinase
LSVIVEDDGAGFDPAAVARDGTTPHLGLSGIRERLSLIGGTMVMESEPGCGTTIFINVPLKPVEAEPAA